MIHEGELKRMNKVKSAVGRVGGCLNRHKKALVIVVLILLIAAVGCGTSSCGGRRCPQRQKAAVMCVR